MFNVADLLLDAAGVEDGGASACQAALAGFSAEGRVMSRGGLEPHARGGSPEDSSQSTVECTSDDLDRVALHRALGTLARLLPLLRLLQQRVDASLRGSESESQ